MPGAGIEGGRGGMWSFVLDMGFMWGFGCMVGFIDIMLYDTSKWNFLPFFDMFHHASCFDAVTNHNPLFAIKRDEIVQIAYIATLTTKHNTLSHVQM